MKDRLFNEILPQVSKPVRYTGNEVNIIKKDWGKARVKMAFAFPDVYEVGMSHIGGKILYGVVNETTDHLLERTFAPWPDMETVMRREHVPLYTLESFRPLTDFDVIGFSLQYELGITNVLNMLDLSGIPVRTKDRGEGFPLVIAGGPVVFNPEPFADFIDVFLIGDGEELLPEFLDCFDRTREMDRESRFLEMSKLEGVYVPELYVVEYNPDGTLKSFEPRYDMLPHKIKKRVLSDLDKAYYPDKPILPYMNIVHDRAVLEVMRGCQRGCRFCHAGIVYRPVRERSVATLQKQARAQLNSTGYEEVSLASLSTLDYSGVNTLVKSLVEEYKDRGVGVSLPSLRVDAFSIDLANEVQKVRKTTLTLAPEAGSQRMRDIINKNVTEEQLMTAVEAAFKSGWNAVKLYFMIGLPGETTEDLDGIIDLVNKVRDLGKKYSRRAVEVRASMACFVPKAHTPFQWQPQNCIQELQEKINYMSKKKFKGIKLSFHDSKTSFLEGIIARGNRRVGEAIYLAFLKGCKLDAWSEYFNYQGWMEAFQESGVDPDFFTCRVPDYNELLPWDFVDTGVTKAYLRKENEKAMQAVTTGDCRLEGCTGCGICPRFGINVDVREGQTCASGQSIVWEEN